MDGSAIAPMNRKPPGVKNPPRRLTALALALFGAIFVVDAKSAAPQNVLFIIGDDIGIDPLGLYGLGPDPPPTPTLDNLAANGVLFRNVWANPLCSPTRATLMTGRYSFRTGAATLVGLVGFLQVNGLAADNMAP